MEQSTNITAQDIANVVNIIDTACARGAFRGGEMTAVGTARDKFAELIAQPKEEPADKNIDAPPQGELNFNTETGSVEEKIEERDTNAVATKKSTAKGKA